jgi:hypothetical protein
MLDPAGPTAAERPAGTTACIRFSKYDLLCYCDPKPQGPLHLSTRRTPKPVEMTKKSTPELFNAQSELDRAMKVAMNDKITGASTPSIHDAPSPPARRSPHAYPAPHAPHLVYQD